MILIQENRSFDHYFGSYRGVRGFSDRSIAFQQPDPANTTISPVGALLPFHLDTSTTNAACTHDITHDWVPQHQSWNNGAMDGFVSSRLPIDSNDAVLSMGYYNSRRSSLLLCPRRCFHDLRQLFLLGDGPDRSESPLHDGRLPRPGRKKRRADFAEHRHKPRSHVRPTDIYDDARAASGPGISWKVYSSPDETIFGGILSDNVLSYFKNFQDPASVLYQNAFGPQFPVDFLADVASGSLPQVSWMVGSVTNLGSSACAFDLWREYSFPHRHRFSSEPGAVGKDGLVCHLR